jgi:hypothetical protein
LRWNYHSREREKPLELHQAWKAAIRSLDLKEDMAWTGEILGGGIVIQITWKAE